MICLIPAWFMLSRSLDKGTAPTAHTKRGQAYLGTRDEHNSPHSALQFPRYEKLVRCTRVSKIMEWRMSIASNVGDKDPKEEARNSELRKPLSQTVVIDPDMAPSDKGPHRPLLVRFEDCLRS